MKKMIWFVLILMIAALVLSVTIFEKNTFAILCLGMVAIMVTLFSLFERKNVATEKIVLIALLSSVASIGRIVFSAIPSVQPASFIIIMTGIAFGGEMGFLTGTITALASNLVLGQGPWTIWQMFCWGVMGWLSAVMAQGLLRRKLVFCVYGLLWGFVFGWIMNAWFVLAGYGDSGLNGKAFIIAGVSSFPMDLAHGVTNSLLIGLFSSSFMKILGRISMKYGLNEGE